MKKPLKFFLITDTHVYARSLGTDGEAFEKKDAYGSTCYKASESLFDAAADLMLKSDDINIVLIAGDLTSNGEYESNINMSKKLQELNKKGKQVIVITATHDYTSDARFPNRVIKSYKCQGGREVETPGTERRELDSFYGEFGRAQAMSVHENSGSYCIKLQEGFRLLCLNDDGNGVNCGYDEECMSWILNCIKESRDAGDFIFAMTHHPLVPPMKVYPMISRRDMLVDFEKTAEIFADAGLSLIFTGHSHIQSIRSHTSKKGNTIYDVGTAALVSYPVPVRQVTVTGETAEIKTLRPKSFVMDGQEYSVTGYTKTRFDSTIYGAIEGAKNDYERLAAILGGISIKREVVDNHKILMRTLGNIADRLTVKGAAKLLMVKADIRGIEKVKIKDLFAGIFRGLYAGEKVIDRNSREYGFIRAVMERILIIGAKAGVKSLDGKENREKIFEIADDIILPGKYDPNNITIPLK